MSLDVPYSVYSSNCITNVLITELRLPSAVPFMYESGLKL